MRLLIALYSLAALLFWMGGVFYAFEGAGAGYSVVNFVCAAALALCARQALSDLGEEGNGFRG